MVDLVEKSPCAGLLPVALGRATLEELHLGRMTSIAALGDAGALSEALEAEHGLKVPQPNRTTTRGEARCIWFGRNEVLLAGPAPDAALQDHAALVDQSDAWAVVALTGETAVEVLARLVPVDLRDGHFALGHTARTQVGHMIASVTRLGADKFMIMVFRSMAETLVHEMKQAMAGVASRG